MIPDGVRERFPWPEVPDDIEAWVANMDGGGRSLIDPLLDRYQVDTMLEIGSFLGGSTLRWLSCSPRLELVAVDPWNYPSVGDFVSSEEGWFPWRKPDPLIVQQLNKPEGFYHTFLANLSIYRDRLVPVRGGEERLEELHALGLRPRVIYIDAHKERKELDICRRLWPKATLTGDDYWWRDGTGYPMQRHVKAFAREHGLRVLHRRHTWVLGRTRVPWFWRWLDRMCPSEEPRA
jgi:hypothetical protein